MSDGTKIEWTQATWSPVTGCTKISDGCRSCYIDRTPPFRMAGRRYTSNRIGATTGVQLHPERLQIPLHWRKPRRIFVCSLADLFHDEVPTDYIVDVFATIAQAPQHSFQVLTKRHARMRSLLSSDGFISHIYNRIPEQTREASRNFHHFANVELGVSVESQKWADVRIDALIEARLGQSLRWLSCEPLLGPLDLTRTLPRLDWVVIGGESGPNSRPMDPAWVRDILTQCRNAGVPAFVKQLGTAWAQDMSVGGQSLFRLDKKGGDPQYWPADLRVREYPTAPATVGGAA